MHTSIVRAQTVFGFFTTVAFAVALLIAGTDFLGERTPRGTIKAVNTQVVMGRPHYYSATKEEYAVIKFSLDADLSSLFNWNTKQVFVYVTAEWPAGGGDGNNATDQAVIWDQIITSPSADHLAKVGPASLRKLKKSAAGKAIDPSRGKLSIKNQRPKYQITHPSSRIAETDNVQLKLHYNVQPWVGVLTWNQDRDYGRWKAIKGGVSKVFSLPAVKKKGDEKSKKAKA
ncbi:Microsomal signal peptidase subunit 3 [Cytospora mali]|uniref:Signal peptidase subunit 3 n=1 Tax=Cytospora mali TaxID=578113 RepID=A0A194W5H4_CYTMA|nr:Microsomal signal peptidase subunit 3 [Valsa mali]